MSAAPAVEDRLLRARHWLRIERLEEAERDLLEVLAEAPANSSALVLLSCVAAARGDLGAAEEHASAARAADPLAPEPVARSAQVQDFAGRLGQAERTWIEAIGLAPWAANYRVALADLLWRSGRADLAEGHWAAALQLDPECADAQAGLAHLALGAGCTRRARARALAALRQNAHHRGAQLAHALTHLQRGRPFAARRELRGMLAQDPEDGELEALWWEVDRWCRWPALPVLGARLLLDRLPGGFFTAVAIAMGLAALGAITGLHALTLPWWVLLAMALYSLIAMPLARLWTRILPPR